MKLGFLKPTLKINRCSHCRSPGQPGDATSELNYCEECDNLQGQVAGNEFLPTVKSVSSWKRNSLADWKILLSYPPFCIALPHRSGIHAVRASLGSRVIGYLAIEIEMNIFISYMNDSRTAGNVGFWWAYFL